MPSTNRQPSRSSMEPSKSSLKVIGSSLHPNWVWELVHFVCQTSEGRRKIPCNGRRRANMTTKSPTAAQQSVQRMVGSLRVFWGFYLTELQRFPVFEPSSLPPPLTRIVGQFRA